MRQSQLFSKTLKELPKGEQSINAQLLIRGGYIDKLMAGVYTFLPLGLRVLNKIENIIRQEMDKIGTEVLMPSLAPQENWQTTGRLETVDVLMKTAPANAAAVAKNDANYILNPTHEDIVTPLLQKFCASYKDLPKAVYQIQTKFRNEPRAKSGLLRCREFRMKDLYSFHTSEADLQNYYNQAKEAYWQTFRRLGLADETYVALASGGDFTENYSHEFQTRCDNGEDILFHAAKSNITFNREVAPSQARSGKSSGQPRPMEYVQTKNVVGVDDLCKFLKLSADQTVKTLIYQNERQDLIVAAVRGDYDVSEYKLAKIVGCRHLELATPAVVKKTTKAEIGYAGLLNLPASAQVYMDEALSKMTNMEMGGNKTDQHVINVNFDRDLPRPDKFYDIKIAQEGDAYPETGEIYEVFKAAEIGNIFPLNTKFTKAFGYNYADEKGQEQIVYMGSYGIGPSRIMGVLVEKFHDQRGIVWPAAVAPFAVHLIQIGDDPAVTKQANQLYDKLLAANVEVLFDDRTDVSAGSKFADSDLLGLPIRLVVSPKTAGQIEYKLRTAQEVEIISLAEALKRLQK